MNIIKAIWGMLRLIGRGIWQSLTLAYPKPDDADNGVNVRGQGR